MNLDPIADYLAAQTALEVAESLFVYRAPAIDRDHALIVAENANAFVDHEVPGVFRNRYQVIVRSSDYDRARTLADEIFNVLNIREVDLGDYVVTYSRPRHKPINFSRSKGDLVEYSINFDIRYRE